MVEHIASMQTFTDTGVRPQFENPEAEAFYRTAVDEMTAVGLPFLLAGTYAVSAYTGISRVTKDLDIFCKAGDSIRILAHFGELGYEIEIEDDRWLSKVKRGNCFFDVIFASANGAMPIGDTWFQNAQPIEAFGTRVWIVGATELVFSKAFVKLRHRYDGADLAHIASDRPMRHAARPRRAKAPASHPEASPRIAWMRRVHAPVQQGAGWGDSDPRQG